MISQELLEFAAKSYGFGADTFEGIPRKSGKVMNEVYIFRKDEKEYIITASAKLDGRTWAYAGSNEKMSFNWGKVMGDMHRASKAYVPSNKDDVFADISGSQYWGRFFDSLKIYPGVYETAQDLLCEIAALPRDGESFGVIHGDLHQGNFFADGDAVSIIDFGDSIYGWFALDIAISLCHALWWDRKDKAGGDYTKEIIESFIKGYVPANRLSKFWAAKIPLFMKYRHLCMDPVKNGLGCDRSEWIYNIENDFLFGGFHLESAQEIIKNAIS